MKILCISGSSRKESSNRLFLERLGQHIDDHEMIVSDLPFRLPLFLAELDSNPLPPTVVEWREMISSADAVIISTPEYIHNMPAALKNALEWITSSGELSGKRTLVFTMTPHPPRGERAMKSLLWSLEALDANVIAFMELYKSGLNYDDGGNITGEYAELLNEAMGMLMG